VDGTLQKFGVNPYSINQIVIGEDLSRNSRFQ